MNPYNREHIECIKIVADYLHKSGQTTLVRPEACFVLVFDASIRGITLATAMAERYQTEKGPMDRAHNLLGKVRKRGGSHEILTIAPEEAAIRLTVRNPDRTTQTKEFRFTWEEAKLEAYPWKKGQRPTATSPGVHKETWETPKGRAQMLWARVVTQAIRAMCPEVLTDDQAYDPDDDDATQADPQAPTLAEALLGPPPPPTVTATAAPAAPDDDGDLAPVAPPAPEPPKAATAAPVAPPAPEPPKAAPAAPPAATVAPVTGGNPPTDGRLDGTTLAALGTAIGPDLGDRAVKFLAGLGWIQNNDLATLTPDRAASIIRRAEAFRAKVEATIPAP